MVDSTKKLFKNLKQANLENLHLSFRIYPKQTHKTAAVITLQDAIQHEFYVQ